MGHYDDEDINSLAEKEEKREKELLASLKLSKRPNRNRVFSDNEIIDLKIMINTSNDVNDVIRQIETSLKK